MNPVQRGVMRAVARASHVRFLGVPLLAPALVLALGCRGGGPDHGAAADTGAAASSAGSSMPATSAPVASSSASSRRVLPRTPPGCRAISVVGTPRLVSIRNGPGDAAGPTTVTESSDIPDDFWVDLDVGAKLTAKHPRSTRETTFTGPGRVRPCVSGSEEAWIAQGKFESVLSSGERPGVEQWVVTPIGVVRYGSARVELDVTPETPTSTAKVDIKVTTGTAFAWTSDQAGPLKPPFVLPANAPNFPDGWTRIEGARLMSITQKKTKPQEAVTVAIDRCKAESTASRDLATAIGGVDASIAQLASKHVVARHLARAACDVALVRSALFPLGPERDGFYATLKAAESDWKTARPQRRRP